VFREKIETPKNHRFVIKLEFITFDHSLRHCSYTNMY